MVPSRLSSLGGGHQALELVGVQRAAQPGRPAWPRSGVLQLRQAAGTSMLEPLGVAGSVPLSEDADAAGAGTVTGSGPRRTSGGRRFIFQASYSAKPMMIQPMKF